MNLGELTGVKLLGVLLLVAVLGSGGLYYTVFKSQRDQNAAAQIKLQAKLRENAELEAYRPKLADIERQLASLKQQLDIERRIVPGFEVQRLESWMGFPSGSLPSQRQNSPSRTLPNFAPRATSVSRRSATSWA